MSEEILAACNEQVGVAEIDDEAGASQAVQMFRALRNKNIFVVYFLAITKFHFFSLYEIFCQINGSAAMNFYSVLSFRSDHLDSHDYGYTT